MRKGELPSDKIRSESVNVENELLDGNLAVAQTSTEPVLEMRAKSQNEEITEEHESLTFSNEQVFDHYVNLEKKMTFSLDLSARRNTIVDSIIEKQCYICDSLMPPYVHHCSECGKCVAYMDHHCPWINNCVGFYTQKVFFLFNFYGLLTLIYSCIVLTYEYKNQIYELDEVTGMTIVVAMSIFIA